MHRSYRVTWSYFRRANVVCAPQRYLFYFFEVRIMIACHNQYNQVSKGVPAQHVSLETHRSLATLRFTAAISFLTNARTHAYIQANNCANSPDCKSRTILFTILCVMYLFRDSHSMYACISNLSVSVLSVFKRVSVSHRRNSAVVNPVANYRSSKMVPLIETGTIVVL